MGNELRYMCLLETRKLLILMAVIFAMVLFVQYVELPYRFVFSSFSYAHKSQIHPSRVVSTADSTYNPNGSRDSPYSSNLNSTYADDLQGDSKFPKFFERSNSNVKDMSLPERNNSEHNFDVDVDPEDELPLNDFLDVDNSSTIQDAVRNNSPNYTPLHNSSLGHDLVGDTVLVGGKIEDEMAKQATASIILSPFISPFHDISSENMDVNSGASVMSPSLNKSSVGTDVANILENKEKPGSLKDDLSTSVDSSSISSSPALEKGVKRPPDAVVPISGVKQMMRDYAIKNGLKRPAETIVSISEMKDVMLQSYASYNSVKPRWSSPVDHELQKIRSMIEHAPVVEKDDDFDVSLYHNFSTFKRSYELMEQTLKVYIYSEGERPIFHQPPLKGIYASEGWFMKLLKANKKFVTKKPTRAHLFYLPFSSRALEVSLYVPNSHSRDNLIKCLSDYVDVISTRYHFWNRTDGADHFLVACHDWAPAETKERMGNCIRALCNADIGEGFKYGKDASLPETYVHSPQNPLRELGGLPPSRRRILAFFAGNMHGYLRPILLHYWENKDPDIKIFGRIRKVKGQMGYAQYMKSSKYCVCARGYEVNSPRVVEAIFYECVPVIISDNFVPPFFDTLNWESFAVFVSEKDIPDLKNILVSISSKRYLKMQQRVKQVRKHFLWHTRPQKYDIFHMILHSVWYNRVFQTR